MADLPESAAEYPAGIYQIEETDPVHGGPYDDQTQEGIANRQALELANRAAWLKENKADKAGSNPPNNNLDEAISFGSYSGYCGQHASASLGDNPFPAEAGAFTLFVAPTATGAADRYLKQTATMMKYLDAVPHIYTMFRVRDVGDWSPWKEVWHSGNTEYSSGTAGYQKLPSGLIMQWAEVLNVNNGDLINFPIAFPTAVHVVAVTDRNPNQGSGNAHFVGAGDETLTRFTASVFKHDLTLTVSGLRYIALGH